MDTADLEKYLYHAIKLETQYNALEKAIQEIDYGVRNSGSANNEPISEPVREKPIAYPELYPVSKMESLMKVCTIFAGLSAFFLIAACVCIFRSRYGTILQVFGWLFVLSFILFVGFWCIRRETKEKIKINEERIRAYESAVNTANYRMAQAQAKHETLMSQIRAKNEQLESNRRDLQWKQDKARRDLENYYSANVIHPYYRGLVPVSLIHHYISTGICSELEGENGAYSKCRAEMRDDRFHSSVGTKLDTIASNQRDTLSALGNIQAQCYMLNLAVRESNEAARNISSAILENNTKMDQFISQSEDMKRFARESAESSQYLSEFISKNRENLERHIMP